MKVLVTGATGFVGSHVVPLLLKAGHRVVATCRSREKARGFEFHDGVKWIEFDVFDLPEAPFDFFGQPDCLIHLAWAGLPNYKDEFHLTENLPADAVFLTAMLEGGLKHLLVTGTCFEYGMQEGELTEDHPGLAETPYGIAKNRLREQIEPVATRCGATFQWARLFYLYGPGQSERTLFAQLQAAIDSGASSFDMSGGQQVRDFLRIDKVAEYLVAIVSQDEISGIINVCSGRKARLLELVEEYLDKRKAKIELNLGIYPYPDWEPFRFWGDSMKLQRILDGSVEERVDV